MKHEETKVEVYYDRIYKLVHGLQILTTNSLLTIVFWAGLQSYLSIVTVRMKQSTLQQHKEAKMLCEEIMTTTKTKNTFSIQ